MVDKSSCHVTFCLCPGYPLFCVASALEVLRHANRYCEIPFFSWTILCEGDEALVSSNGIRISPTVAVDTARIPDIAVVVAGFEPMEIEVPQIDKWIKNAAVTGC